MFLRESWIKSKKSRNDEDAFMDSYIELQCYFTNFRSLATHKDLHGPTREKGLNDCINSGVPLLERLRSNPLCHILSVSFETSKAIAPVTKLTSNASLILWVLTVKTSAVDLQEWKITLLVPQDVISGKVVNYPLVNNRFEDFANGIKKAGVDIVTEWKRLPEFLRTRQAFDNFHRPGKHFSLRQQHCENLK